MATLLYIHGFLSSPLSTKAQQVKQWLVEQRPDITFCCPQLPPYPDQCAQILMEQVTTAKTPIYVMGSSLGGFWSTWLAEQIGCKAVLINPAVDVMTLIPPFLHQTLNNYHHSDTYFLTDDHLQQLQHYCVSELTEPKRYWLLVQTGDETLDYRLAVEKYAGCRHTVEQGGDHSFQRFERFISDIINFFETQ